MGADVIVVWLTVVASPWEQVRWIAAEADRTKIRAVNS